MASLTFKRNKVINAIKRYARMMEEARKESEDYAEREAKQPEMTYYKEMKELNHARFVAYRFVVGDMKYEFGITDDELKKGESA